MVSVLDSGLIGPGLSPGWGTAWCSWARHFTLIVPLSTQVYKWVLANLLLGVTLRWTSISSMGSRNNPSCFMLWKPGYALACWATWLVCRLDFTVYYCSYY